MFQRVILVQCVFILFPLRCFCSKHFPKSHSVVRKVSVSLLENGPKNRWPFNSDDDLSYQWSGYYCVTIVPLMNKGR